MRSEGSMISPRPRPIGLAIGVAPAGFEEPNTDCTQADTHSEFRRLRRSRPNSRSKFSRIRDRRWLVRRTLLDRAARRLERQPDSDAVASSPVAYVPPTKCRHLRSAEQPAKATPAADRRCGRRAPKSCQCSIAKLPDTAAWFRAMRAARRPFLRIRCGLYSSHKRGWQG